MIYLVGLGFVCLCMIVWPQIFTWAATEHDPDSEPSDHLVHPAVRPIGIIGLSTSLLLLLLFSLS